MKIMFVAARNWSMRRAIFFEGVYRTSNLFLLLDMLDTTVDSIEKVAELVELKKALTSFRKRGGILEVAMMFLKKERCLMYGGRSINSMLPKNQRFYKDIELPDIDIYCLKGTATDIATRLKDALVKKDFELTQVQKAEHEGTVKVFSKGLPVCDITEIEDEHIWKRMWEDKILLDRDQPYSCSPEFIFASSFRVLSQPQDADFRWKKTVERILVLNEYLYGTTKRKIELVENDVEDDKKMFRNTTVDMLERLLYVNRDILPDTMIGTYMYETYGLSVCLITDDADKLGKILPGLIEAEGVSSTFEIEAANSSLLPSRVNAALSLTSPVKKYLVEKIRIYDINQKDEGFCRSYYTDETSKYMTRKATIPTELVYFMFEHMFGEEKMEKKYYTNIENVIFSAMSVMEKKTNRFFSGECIGPNFKGRVTVIEEQKRDKKNTANDAKDRKKGKKGKNK